MSQKGDIRASNYRVIFIVSAHEIDENGALESSDYFSLNTLNELLIYQPDAAVRPSILSLANASG